MRCAAFRTGVGSGFMTFRQLASRKAVLTRHLGADDPRTLEAAAALRTALLKRAITDAVAVAPLTGAEIVELTALLLAGAGA